MKKQETLEQRLHTLGRRCFVNCFELAWQKGGKLTDAEIEKCDPEVGTKVLKNRAGIIKSIFADGQQLDALQDCMYSTGLKDETRAEAKRLYDSYKNRPFDNAAR